MDLKGVDTNKRWPVSGKADERCFMIAEAGKRGWK